MMKNFKVLQTPKLMFRHYNLNVSKINILSKDLNNKFINPMLNKQNKYFYSQLKHNNIIRYFGKKGKKVVENNTEKEKEEIIEIDFKEIEDDFKLILTETKEEASKMKYGKINIDLIKNLEIKIKNKKQPLFNFGQVLLKGNVNCQIVVFEEANLTNVFKSIQNNLKDYDIILDKNVILISISNHNIKEQKTEFLKKFKLFLEEKKNKLKNLRKNKMQHFKKLLAKSEKNFKIRVEKFTEDTFDKNRKEIDNLLQSKEREIN